MYYGFDIGGTKIAFAVYDGALNLCHEERMSTPGNDYEGMQQLIRERVEQADARSAPVVRWASAFPAFSTGTTTA